MTYAIILSTYNWPEALGIILESLLPQLKIHTDVDIIIADDGSTTDTKTLIERFQNQLPDRISHIWHEDIGFRKSVVLNKAVAAAANADYLLFLDGDCIPFPDYITQHKKLAETGYFVAGNRVLLSRQYTSELMSNHQLVNQIFSWNFALWVLAKAQKKVNKVFSFLRLNVNAKWRYSRSSNWKYPKGCNVGIFRLDFVAVNGYDAVFSGWGHEDADLFIRLLHNNIKIKDGRFAIPVLHLWHKESSRINESANYARLMERLQDKSAIQAQNGIKNI